MAGINPDISTSSFKPLSLDEIMMVPLALQKQEDELLSSADKISLLKADVLGPDSEKASNIIESYKSKASNISDEVIKEGVNRNQFHKLRGLRSEIQEQQSSGFLGAAISNKKSASQFINDLATKKERQAGWSPSEAKQWAMKQVSDFKGTQNEDGTFSSFSGQELDTKVDEADWIRKNIDDVSEQISSSALRAVKVGGLPAFQRAFANQEVSSKDFNTIMNHLNTQARTDKDLQRSLMQSAAFTEEENSLDFGKFETKTFKKDDGTEASKKVWVVGKGRFARRMAGMADASDYRNTKVNHKIIKDDVGFSLWKSGMEERQTMKLIGFGNGEATDITRDDLSQLRTNLDLALDQSDLMLDNVNKQKDILLSNDKEYQKLNEDLNKRLHSVESKEILTKKIKDRENAVLSSNNHYMKLQSDYSKAATKWNNAKYAVEAAYTSAEKTMTPREKTASDMNKFVLDNVPGYNQDRITSLEREIRSLPGGEDIIPEGGLSQIGVGEEEMENFLVSKFLELNGYQINKNSIANRSIYNWIGDKNLAYDSDIVSDMKMGGRVLNEKLEMELDANPKAQSYTILTADDVGGIKSPAVAQNNKLLKTSLNPQSMQMAFGGGIMTEDTVEEMVGESSKGYDYTPQMTESWDNNGNKIVNIVIKNLETEAVSTQPIINNLNRENDIVAAEQMVRSENPKQARIGRKIIYGYRYMPDIKSSNMNSQNKGEIGGLPLSDESGKEMKVNWSKSEDGSYFTASINGFPLKDGQAIYGEEDMLHVIAGYIEGKILQSQNQ